MTSVEESIRANIRRWTLLLGVLQITVGCMIGFIPPDAVAWFRGIVMAHIEFTANGVLMIAFGFLVNEMRLSLGMLKLWFAALQIGTWTNGAAGFAGAIVGSSSALMTTINQKFPPPHDLDNAVVTGLLTICGVGMMVVLLLTLYGLLPRKSGG